MSLEEEDKVYYKSDKSNKIRYLNMSKEKEDKLSNDIRDWQFKDTLVVFEEFQSTLKRSEDDSVDTDDEDDYIISTKSKEMTLVHPSQLSNNFHPEFLDPEKHFKLWTVYTKIPLTTKVLLKIENTDGIESIEALSKYRARIGIGPLFKDGPVMLDVKNIIFQSLKTDLEETIS